MVLGWLAFYEALGLVFSFQELDSARDRKKMRILHCDVLELVEPVVMHLYEWENDGVDARQTAGAVWVAEKLNCVLMNWNCEVEVCGQVMVSSCADLLVIGGGQLMSWENDVLAGRADQNCLVWVARERHAEQESDDEVDWQHGEEEARHGDDVVIEILFEAAKGVFSCLVIYAEKLMVLVTLVNHFDVCRHVQVCVQVQENRQMMSCDCQDVLGTVDLSVSLNLQPQRKLN